MKNVRNVLSENVHVLVVKFSIYLKRRVFVMIVLSNCLQQLLPVNIQFHTMPSLSVIKRSTG